MITKAVIAAAGRGTRLLPATKEQPKEMLPIFSKSSNGSVLLKPLLQLIFEQLHSFGIRDFCFVIGRGKRAIEDHFTPDHPYIADLKETGKASRARDLESFYQMLQNSKLVWVNQPAPRGFGDAVLTAEPFVGRDKFLVHAGDTLIPSVQHLQAMMKLSEKVVWESILLSQQVDDPKDHGILELEHDSDPLKVRRALEKPEKPPSNHVIIPVYLFRPSLFDALRKTRLDERGELQLTDAIQHLIEEKGSVYAVSLAKNAFRHDIGSIEKYWDALRLSYQYATSEAQPSQSLREES